MVLQFTQRPENAPFSVDCSVDQNLENSTFESAVVMFFKIHTYVLSSHNVSNVLSFEFSFYL